MASMPRTTSHSEGTLPVIIIDTREQQPYSFDPAHALCVRRALAVGDYSLEGYEGSIAVERKSLEDFVSSAVTSRERFGRELRALAEYDFACVVVEASMEDILEHRYRAGIHPASVFGATLSIIIDVGVPVYFCSDRQIACRFVEDALCRYHRKVRGA